MTTITLLKIGTQKLGLSSAEIMKYAVDLYNLGYISYPRTETD